MLERLIVPDKLRRQHRFLNATEATRADSRRPLFNACQGINATLVQASQKGIVRPRLPARLLPSADVRTP